MQRDVRFRNRLAHNEPILSTRTGLEARLADVATLFQMVDTDAYHFVASHSDLATVLTA